MRWVMYRRRLAGIFEFGFKWDRLQPACGRQACPLAFIECDFVRKARSEGLRLGNGAQAGVPVPLKSKKNDVVLAPSIAICAA